MREGLVNIYQPLISASNNGLPKRNSSYGDVIAFLIDALIAA